jgi:hypothetical protein
MSSSNTVAERFSPSVNRNLREILAPRDDGDVFPEFALTLYAFITALAKKIEGKTERVCFLSREGQPLMDFYQTFQARRPGGPQATYLEVSRRATLLPSLGPLAREQFRTLFRQYRAISPFEFLASLGLEAYLEELAGSLSVTCDNLRSRRRDLPTDPLFQELVRSARFASLYENERCNRRSAFISYLRAIHGGDLPNTLRIVDVGWKGTIQDNLRALLSDTDTSIRNVSGFYIGLVAPGDASASNEKQGVLFSCVDGVTPFFRTFNENRALFEVVLAADHGSVVTYHCDGMQNGFPVRGAFEEDALVRQVVRPVQSRLSERFLSLCELMEPVCQNFTALFNTAAKTHARMVFRPRRAELEWFSDVFHVENYGVFERSEFIHRRPAGTLRDRLAFVARLRNRSTWPDLGFWPYKTIRDQGGAWAARVYGRVRQLQG